MSIRLANVSKDFGNTKVLSDVSIEIEPGEFFVMVGPSGSGKSTLLRMIAGLTSVTDGRIYFNDRDVTDLPPKDRKLAMVFQNYALLPFMNVAQNIRFGLENQDLNDDEKASESIGHWIWCTSATYGIVSQKSCQAASNSGSAWRAR